MKASNSNKNLKGTDRDEAVVTAIDPQLSETPLTAEEQDYTESFFVTRSEWNDLMERIAKHSRQSPHPF